MSLIIQETIHFSVFISVHHSFGFSDIFLEGGLEIPKTPLDPPLLAVHGVSVFCSLEKWCNSVRFTLLNAMCMHMAGSPGRSCMHTHSLSKSEY